MKLEHKNILIIGATGDLGAAVARRLNSENANIVLVGRSKDKLATLATDLPKSIQIIADINHEKDREKIFQKTLEKFNQIDVVINIAGLMSFNEFILETDEITNSLFQTNVISPMLLNKKIAKHMIENSSGSIVNIGSIFGSIPFALFSSYSATKAALKAYSESLRRELEGTGVNVSYIAPRAIRTKFNSNAINEMNNKFKISMDDPDFVANEIINAIKLGKKDKYIGYPEKLFVRINALMPRLVDKALKKQNQEAKQFI
jgi:short-subunit dehydrogenase